MTNLSKLQADNIKTDDKPIADGTVSGLRLHPGKIKGHGKWLMRFVSPETNKRREMGSLSSLAARRASTRTVNDQ